METDTTQIVQPAVQRVRFLDSGRGTVSEKGFSNLSREIRAEAEHLCTEILESLEQGSPLLTGLALKAARVAHLLGNKQALQLFEFEAKGYPTDGPLSQDLWKLALAAGRRTLYYDPKTKQKSPRVYTESIEALETRRSVADRLLSRAISWMEQNSQTVVIQTVAGQLAGRRAVIHGFATKTLHALKFADVAGDVFQGVHERVTRLVALHVASGAQHLASVYDNLRSSNSEDWANAVHSCRRLLKDVADAVFPATDPIIVGGKEVRLGGENYVNRLVTFVSRHSDSERFQAIVGSDLSFLVDRLDSIYSASNKGTHATVTKEEADRYVVHTYLMVGDILSLLGDRLEKKTPGQS